MFQLREKTSPVALYTEGKSINYYSETKYGLGYTSSELEMNILQQISSESTLAPSQSVSNHDSDYDLKRMFQQMIINMVSTTANFVQERSDYEDLPKAWAQKMVAQWELQVEQREPLIENQVVQMNMGDDRNSKLIFVSKNPDKNELQILIELIRKYMDIFAQNYEDIPRLDPKIVQHHLNVKPNTKLVK